jgi:hypothetical protein
MGWWLLLHLPPELFLQCLTKLCEQCSAGLPSAVMLARALVLSSLGCGLFHGRNQQRKIAQVPPVGDKLWPGQFLRVPKPAKMLDQLSCGLGLVWGWSKTYALVTTPQKGISLAGVLFLPWIVLNLGEVYSCFFVKRFFLTSLKVSFYSSNKEGFGSGTASMQWQLYSIDGVSHLTM